MSAIRTPRSIAAATSLAERFAILQADLAGNEAKRNIMIADANAAADRVAEPLIAERDAIAAKLEIWWPTASAELLTGKRKTTELGGCLIGTKAGRSALTVAADEVAVAAVLAKRKWATGLVRVKVSLDKAAIFKAVDGERKRELRKLGFGKSEPGEMFVLERAEQEGTRP